MNTHSPFEPGYIGNGTAGAVGVLDQTLTFPDERFAAAGASPEELARMRADFNELDIDTQRDVIAHLVDLPDDDLTAGLDSFRRAWADEAAYDALSDEDKAALAALSEDDLAALQEPPAAVTGVVAPDEVPDGTVESVLEWVNGDAGRAETALAVEETRDQPRTTLTAALLKIANPGE